MLSFPEELKRRRLLFDGSMGALLSSMGRRSDHPDLFSLTEPELIQDIHRRYFQAGARVIITNSLGATPLGLRRSGFSEKAGEIAAAAVRNARAAVGSEALVALDMGSTGEFIEPAGSHSLREMIDNFSVCAQAGAEAGADLILLETMTDIAECRAACLAARKTGLPVAASFAFSRGGRTLTGGTPECAALTLAAAGVCAVGANCSSGSEPMLPILAAMRSVTPLPVIIQPNAGMPEIDKEGNAHYPLSPKEMLPHMERILAAGACAVGGCCGTTPEHIALFAQLPMDTPPESSWDGKKRICSARNHVLLDEALDQAAEIADVEDLYDLEDEPAARLDLSSLSSPEEAGALIVDAQSASGLPLILCANDPEVLESALMNYHGVAAVSAPENCGEVCARYGAIRL